LNIGDIERVSPGLGDNVTIISVANGMHDILLSSEEVRTYAFNQITEWLNQKGIKFPP
jgi:alpha-beta hydrolase superfamily lysophospholipase